MSRNIVVESEPPVAIVTLNRPERRNALSADLMRNLIEAIQTLKSASDIHAIILAAAGPAFSSGHDLTELVGREEYDCRSVFDLCTELMTLIQSMPQPVIAEVNGIATAAGCQLVATCDLAIAAEGASFATPGVRIGLFCTTPMVAVARAIGRKRALEMLLTGKVIDCRTAVEWGLVNRAVPLASLREETLKLAREISEASALTLSIGKQAFYAQADMDQSQAYAYAKDVMTANAMSQDAQEGMSAFLGKRKPEWAGR